MDDRRILHSEALVRLETKLEELSAKLGETHTVQHEFVKLSMEREARKAQLQQAIIEKTLGSLLWSGIVGLIVIIWTYTKDHLK